MQANWNVQTDDGNLRLTEFVPTTNDVEEVALKVYDNRENKKAKMSTIKEEGRGSDAGSDTAYFNNSDEDQFNNRDDFDEEEERKFD